MTLNIRKIYFVAREREIIILPALLICLRGQHSHNTEGIIYVPVEISKYFFLKTTDISDVLLYGL